MERGINFVIIGVCFIITLLGFIVFIFWFGDYSLDAKSTYYKAYSKNAIGGIKINTDVRYKGINVGRVKNITFSDENFNSIVFEIAIRRDLKIKKDSILKVEQDGLLDRGYFHLIQNEESSEFIESSQDRVLQIQTSTMSKILASVPNITDKVENLLSNANTIMNEENAKNIATILVSIQDSANGINKIVRSLQSNTEGISSLIDNVNKISHNAQIMLETIDKKIKNGEYDMKTTLTPTLQSIEQLATHLDSMVKESEILLDNLKENPYNTIFGYRSDDENN